MRDRGSGLRIVAGAVAALVHRSASQPGRRSAGLEAVQLRLSLFLGPRGRDRGLHQHVGPAADQQDGRRAVPQRRRRQCLGRQGRGLPARARQAWLQARRSGPLPESHRQFLGPDHRLQGRERGNHHRRRAAARLHHLLETGAAAGLQAQGRFGRQGDPVPELGGSARHATATTSRPRCGGRRAIRSSRR